MRRPATERLHAWIVTGPLGHLWSALADMTVIWTRWLLFRTRTRASGLPGAAPDENA